MKSIVFEIPATQFSKAEQYIMGPIPELTTETTVQNVWCIIKDTAGGSSPCLMSWIVSGDKKLQVQVDESKLQPSDTVIITLIYSESHIPAATGSNTKQLLRS